MSLTLVCNLYCRSRNVIRFFFQQVICLFLNRLCTTITSMTKVGAGWRGSGWCLSMSMTLEVSWVRFSYLQLIQWKQLGYLNWWMRYELQCPDAIDDRKWEATCNGRVARFSLRCSWGLCSSGMWNCFVECLVTWHFERAWWRYGPKCPILFCTLCHSPDETKPQSIVLFGTTDVSSY